MKNRVLPVYQTNNTLSHQKGKPFDKSIISQVFLYVKNKGEKIMDLMKILMESCELLETDEYNRWENKLIDGKDINEQNRISDELSNVIYAEKYNAFRAGFHTAIQLVFGGNEK